MLHGAALSIPGLRKFDRREDEELLSVGSALVVWRADGDGHRVAEVAQLRAVLVGHGGSGAKESGVGLRRAGNL